MAELKDVLDDTLRQPLRKPSPISNEQREVILRERLGESRDGRPASTPDPPESGVDLGPFGLVGSAARPLRTLIIGGGQAGLSAAYHVRRHELRAFRDFLVVDADHLPGGAWQHRPADLTYEGVHAIHDLPGLSLGEALPPEQVRSEQPIAELVRAYFGAYERDLNLPILRPFEVTQVERAHPGPLLCVTGHLSGRDESVTEPVRLFTASIINATGTWTQPFIPYYPGQDEFVGIQLHSKHLTHPERFAGLRVGVVGGGFSAVQSLLALHRAGASTVWFTRKPPEVRSEAFDTEFGHQVEVSVGEAVTRGELPGSVVSYTKLARTPIYRAAEAAGLLSAHPMFSRLVADGVVRWVADQESHKPLDAVVWCTGYRPAIAHLQPLRIRSALGGLPMTGRLSTRVVGEDRVHLVGYGPSASTSGAARAGRIAARDVAGLFPPPPDAPVAR
ncbi:NAD(P)/FAD-dependent oxidoreductase [Micrococcales bacterium 31B]|nr:NAD(P)/FAD-dependent oxidoreductase [Micrococcales bacterium 31B]